jgi:heme O synthase-like polyprenyltransferase
VNPGILSCVCVSALRGWFAVWKWDKRTFLMNNDKDLDLIIKHTAEKIREQKFDEAIKPTLGLLFGIFASIVMIFSGNTFLGFLGLIGLISYIFTIFWTWKRYYESAK